MTQKLQVYRCKICDNMVEMVRPGIGTLVCCNQNMRLLNEGETDAATEKHVPVIKKEDGGFRVTVGSIEHPMQDEHLIEWIELIADGKAYRQFLSPGLKPEAVFNIAGDDVTAREFCNLHGLWKA